MINEDPPYMAALKTGLITTIIIIIIIKVIEKNLVVSVKGRKQIIVEHSRNMIKMFDCD